MAHAVYSPNPCQNWDQIMDQSFHMARTSMNQPAPPRHARSKPLVTRGSPHADKVYGQGNREYVTEGETSGCETADTYITRQAAMNAACAGQLRGTGDEMEALGFHGRSIAENRAEDEFVDKHICPYTGPAPEVYHEHPPPNLKSARKPTVGLIDYKKNADVWISRKVIRVTYPDRAPVSTPRTTRSQVPLRTKQSPDRKPWEWPAEEPYPGTSSTHKIIKQIKYKLNRLEKNLSAVGKHAVKCREPRLGQEKRFGRLDDPTIRSTPKSYAQGLQHTRDEDRLRNLRKDYAKQHRKRLLFGDSPQDECDDGEEFEQLQGGGSPVSMASQYYTPPSSPTSEYEDACDEETTSL